MSRRRQQLASELYQLPSLPFLSIMLGLMSFMALTILGITAIQRQDAKDQTAVELVGVPARFVPFHIRCRPGVFEWLADDGRWRETPVTGVLAQAGDEYAGLQLSTAGRALMRYLFAKIEENKHLSYSERQNTLILWIEPDAVDVSYVLQRILAIHRLPLRVGSLPIQPGEAIQHVGAP
jgi:hypothetical protein